MFWPVNPLMVTYCDRELHIRGSTWSIYTPMLHSRTYYSYESDCGILSWIATSYGMGSIPDVGKKLSGS